MGKRKIPLDGELRSVIETFERSEKCIPLCSEFPIKIFNSLHGAPFSDISGQEMVSEGDILLDTGTWN